MRAPTGKGLLRIKASKQSVRYGRAQVDHPMGFLAPRNGEGVVVEARGSVDDMVETATRASESWVVYSRGR